MRRANLRPWMLLAPACAAFLAAAGCRCGSSTPGKLGQAATALDAIPGDVDAVILINVEGLRQGSLGEFFYTPWVVRQFEEWGGAPCAALPSTLAKTAALGARLAGEGGLAQEIFFAAEGPTIDDIKRCVDEHAKRQGLSASFEDVAGVRALTDGRGLHVLAAGPRVVARSFPFANRSVLARVSKVASGEAPALSANTSFRGLLERLGGDVTLALSQTSALFAAYGKDLEAGVEAMLPEDLCVSPMELTLGLTMARAQGLGELKGIEAFLQARFKDQPRICVRDVVREAFRTLGRIQALGVTLTGRADVELTLLLVFDDAAPAGDFRGVLGDLVYVLGVLPQKLDVLERDWPMAVGWLSKRIDLGELRAILRNPAFKQMTVGGEGVNFELHVQIDEPEVRAAVESTQQTLSHLVAKE